MQSDNNIFICILSCLIICFPCTCSFICIDKVDIDSKTYACQIFGV